MKLVIVHYHFRPGGIRRVIELATPHLLHQLGNVDKITFAGGEAGDRKWNQQFEKLVAPVPVEIFTAPAFGYFSEQHSSGANTTRRVAVALEKIVAGMNGENCLVWAHNLGIGRNLILARELARACAARGIRLISHHHDWWFDNRWMRWPEMRRSGFSTLGGVARTIFPAAPVVRHAAINHEDATLLQRQFPRNSGWLPNPAARSAAPAPARARAARRWLQRQLGERDVPAWILPCRLLRRKNVAEALLLTRWLRPEAWLVTTGGVSSADEFPYFERLNAAARKHRWRLRLGVLQGDEQRKPAVAELLAASEAVLLTSIQEGFGLPYIEAAAAGRPLIARSLPNIAPDLKKFGFNFPQSYDEIFVHTRLFDWKAEQARQRKAFSAWRRGLPPSVRKISGQPAVLAVRRQPEAVPFSRLTLTAQLEVLAESVAHSWAICAPLNPFLRVWQRRAADGRLKVTRWPQAATRWLGGEAYAWRFVDLAQSSPQSEKSFNAMEMQSEFIEKKLCAANVYPLLWASNV